MNVGFLLAVLGYNIYNHMPVLTSKQAISGN